MKYRIISQCRRFIASGFVWENKNYSIETKNSSTQVYSLKEACYHTRLHHTTMWRNCPFIEYMFRIVPVK